MDERQRWVALRGSQVARLDATRTFPALLATVLLWASAFAAIRVCVKTFGPGELALLRFGVASIVLGIYAAAVHMPMPDKQDWGAIALMGVLGFTIYHWALNRGAITVPAGATSLLVATAPIFTALLAMIVLRERLRIWGWIGIGVSFCGTALIAMRKLQTFELDFGAGFVVLSAVCASGYFVIQKAYLRKYRALELTTYVIWAGTVPLIFFAPGLSRQLAAAPLSATLAAIYLGVFPGAAAYVTWAYVLARSPASVAASALYLIPAFAFLIAWIWLGETPSANAVFGGMLAIAGVVMVNGWGKPAVIPES